MLMYALHFLKNKQSVYINNSIEFFDGIQQFIALVVAVIVHRKDFVLILFKTRKALACCRLYSYDTSLFNILVKTF